MNILGNSVFQKQLQTFLESNELPLTTCLSGPSGIGKYTFVEHLTTSLVGQSDLMFAELGVAGAREAVEFCRTSPLRSEFRVVVVRDAHLLLEPAQDAYLKLCEDPPDRARVIFIADDDGWILAPLRSRFRLRMFWKPLDSTEIRLYAESVGEVNEDVLALCSGRPGLYSVMVRDARYHELYARIVSFLDSPSEDDLINQAPDIVRSGQDKKVDRSALSHVIRQAAKVKPGKVSSHFLQLASLLARVPSANAEIHWFRTLAQIMLKA